uniref:Translocon at the inner envelope membrane of chloroplasts 214 n=1 Tax=Strongyloides papillosus TaxID=174720 RepID=A0A0N5B5V7_STREA
FTQYVHNFSHMTNQEGKPKEYILSTVDRYINEDYTNNNISGRRDLLHFIKNKFRENDNSTTENDNEFTYIPNNTIVFKKIQTAHKNDQQYDGPFRISEHLHGDTYLLHRITKSGRPTGQPIKSNARFLKLAPAIIQNNPNALELMTNISNPPIDEEHAPDITTENIIEPEKKKRGRPRKLPIPTEQKSHTNAPEAETHNQQPTLRKRGRPRKNNTKN